MMQALKSSSKVYKDFIFNLCVLNLPTPMDFSQEEHYWEAVVHEVSISLSTLQSFSLVAHLMDTHLLLT